LQPPGQQRRQKEKYVRLDQSFAIADTTRYKYPDLWILAKGRHP